MQYLITERHSDAIIIIIASETLAIGKDRRGEKLENIPHVPHCDCERVDKIN